MISRWYNIFRNVLLFIFKEVLFNKSIVLIVYIGRDLLWCGYSILNLFKVIRIIGFLRKY